MRKKRKSKDITVDEMVDDVIKFAKDYLKMDIKPHQEYYIRSIIMERQE